MQPLRSGPGLLLTASASNTRDDAAKLKWDGVRCLFEDAQCDMLLVLDSCAVKDTPAAGRHGVKQAMAAYTPDQASRESGSMSFTAGLVASLLRLGTGRSFGIHRLYEETLAEMHRALGQRRPTNAVILPGALERKAVLFDLTPSTGRNITLAPLRPVASVAHGTRPYAAGAQSSATSLDVQAANAESAVDVAFDEPRVLVCTTFVGEASADMVYFNQWLQERPPVASKVTVEGMFLGPPTMLMISMPHAIWNVVQHDNVCCFLGYISSHNMIHLYKRLVAGAPPAAAVPVPVPKPVGDGRILREAKGALAASPGAPGRENAGPFSMAHTPDALRLQQYPAQQGAAAAAAHFASSRPKEAALPDPREDGVDSAEVHKAAEQLKALSHVRHLSDDASPILDPPKRECADSIDVRQEGFSSPDANDSGREDSHRDSGSGTLLPKNKARRPLQKQTPRQETRCGHCSHAPFKDSSSLRKHFAAAHTRPFSCAFSFAGCPSTFGSKNEWKRHIASQHLCLQYYRCSSCPQNTTEGKGNEFNRKDLFTQHLRRMHAPFAIKKAMAKGDGKLQAEWENHVKDMQSSCLVTRRQPPQRSACPKPDCQSVFEGPGAWDEWTEHVGRHMEKGEAERLLVDQLLADWALGEGIIEKREEGGYMICGGGGGGGGGGPAPGDGGGGLGGNGTPAQARTTTQRDDEDPSITVAICLSDSERRDAE